MTYYSSQIVKTLSDQVQNLTPLRESFKHLQIYYTQLTNEFSDLLRCSDKSQTQLLTHLRYLEEVHRGLQKQFSCCGEELRQMECENARLLMEKNQNLAQSEALKSRQMLELQQKANLQNKRKELIDHCSKIQFTINKYKEMVHDIELVIKSKQYENLDIQRQIKKMELVNAKITQYNNEAQSRTDQIQKSNQTTVQQIHELECKLETYDKLIETKQKQNKESIQTLISRTQELEQLKHRKDYIQKLIDTQLCQQRELTKAYGELDSILGIKKDKIAYVLHQNKEYQAMIEQQRASQLKNKHQYAKLKAYLQTLSQTNEVLFQQLQKSCSQDREVQIMLSQKLEKLLVVNDKIAQNDILNRCDAFSINNRSILKDRSSSSQKSPPKDYGMISPKPITKIQSKLLEQRSVLRSREMSTTWGSHTKQNLFSDL